MMLFAMANAGLPGTSGFVGEFLVILTVFKTASGCLSCGSYVNTRCCLYVVDVQTSHFCWSLNRWGC